MLAHRAVARKDEVANVRELVDEVISEPLWQRGRGGAREDGGVRGRVGRDNGKVLVRVEPRDVLGRAE